MFCAAASTPSVHSTPAAATAPRPGQNGRTSLIDVRSRSRQASHRLIGTTTNPCWKISVAAQVSTSDFAVPQ